MAKNKIIKVKGTEIAISQSEQTDYLSLTDIAKHKDCRFRWPTENIRLDKS